MLSNYILAVILFFSTHLNALPLNINLGAYSPALVVGDGEISFGGKQDVSNLMNALQGASASGGAAVPPSAQPAPPPQNPAPAPAPPAAASAPNPVSAADLPIDAQITALQGMGKEIAPRIAQLHKAASKRDLAGFSTALNYASNALTKSPEVSLGTGKEGSGVGILQKAGGTTSAPERPQPARRDVVDRGIFSPKMKTTVTTMLVRGGPLPASASGEESKIEKREPSPSAIDGVNLNMAEGQVAELTFVETREADDGDEDEDDD